MAAGIGEASAIATFLQLGLSIATTLNTYINDVRDAPTEVCDLANEINSTLWQVEVLNTLIAHNDPTNGWSAKGVVFAQKCLAESEKIVKKILTLLQKGSWDGGRNGKEVVTLESLDLSLFTKLKWPTFKPQLEKVKRRLECIRMDICLLVGMHKAISGATKEERDTASDAVVKFAQGSVTAKAVLRRITAMQKENMDEPQSPPPTRGVRFEEPRRRRSRRFPKPSGYKIDLGPDLEPMTLSGNDPEDVHIQFTSLTSAIREMINDELQAEEKARKKAEEEKLQHEQQVLEDYKRSLVEKYTDLERKSAALREQLKRGFEPELPDEQIDTHIKRLQAKELSNDEILRRIADMGVRQTGNFEIESDQATLISTTNRPENGRLWSQLRKGLKDGDSNPIPMALRQNQTMSGVAKVTSISLSFDGEEWHVVQVNVSMPWLIKRLAAEEKKDSKSLGKINETLKAYSKLPRECRFAADAWLQAAGNRKYAWALLYAHTTKTNVSKPRKMLQKAVFGSSIEAQVDNVLLVFRATRDSHGHAYDDRKADEDADDRAKTPANESASPDLPTPETPDSPASEPSVPKLKPADSRRMPEGANPFSQAYHDLPPPPAHLHPGYYTQQYPYPSPMGRPPAAYAGSPSSLGHYVPYQPYGPSSYDPFSTPYSNPYYPQYPAPSPFTPMGYDHYAPYPAPQPSPPPTSQRPPSSYYASGSPPPAPSASSRPYGEPFESGNRYYTGSVVPPFKTSSSSKPSRSVVIHDPRNHPISSSDERSKRSTLSSSRRPSVSYGASSSRRPSVSHRADSSHRRRSPSFSSDESWSPVELDNRDSDRTARATIPRRATPSDSGYSSRSRVAAPVPRKESPTHQPPNWTLYRPTKAAAASRPSSPEFSDDSSNLSVDAKTLKEEELKERLLSKYTTSEVGSGSGAGSHAEASIGPKIEEVLDGDGEEEDLWAGFVTAAKKKKMGKKGAVNGANGDGEGNGRKDGDEDGEDFWGGWGVSRKDKKKKKGRDEGDNEGNGVDGVNGEEGGKKDDEEVD